MLIGYDRQCISPQMDTFYLIGYRSPTRYDPALGIHDNIYINALLLDDGENEVFILSADLLEIEEEMAHEVKKELPKRYNIDENLVLLAATHNHSSLASYHKTWYTQKFNQSYYDFLVSAILKSYENCCRTKQKASLEYGKTVIEGYYGNRNHKGEFADNEVILIKFIDSNGQAFAGCVNWAVHSTVISPTNRYLTSEWAGEVSKKLEKQLGFYPLMLVGAAGDCSNRHQRQGNDFAELERVSQGMAEQIAAIPCLMKMSLNELTYHCFDYPIYYQTAEINRHNREAIASYEYELESLADQERIAFVKKEIEKLTKLLELNEVDLTIPITLVKIGALFLVAFPGELGSKFGQEIKANHPDLTIILGYTNGYYGYFLPRSEYGLSFETIGSLIPKGEPEKIVAKIIEEINRL